MKLLRRTILALLLVCLGCSAQSTPSDLSQKIEHQVRAFYNIPADVQILVSPFRPSPEFPDYQLVTITMDGQGKKQNYDFLLSKDQKTLIRMTKMDLTKDPYLEVMKKIDVSGRPVRGNKGAKVVVVNYDDFQCPFCSRMHQTLFPEILKEYGDRVEFVYKDFPLDIHPWATRAAVDANCLASQNNDAYWEFADYIHANQREVSQEKTREAQYSAVDKIATMQGQKHQVDQTTLQSCIKAQNDSAVKASIKEGENVGVTATPTLFVNGQEIDGALPPDEVRATLDRALERAGVPAPKHSSASGTPPGN